jgi:hypothetical protein
MAAAADVSLTRRLAAEQSDVLEALGLNEPQDTIQARAVCDLRVCV